MEQNFDNKREFWRWIINLIISILTAFTTALGAVSCVAVI